MSMPWAKDHVPPSTLPVITVIKLLRVAMGYGSRTERIQRMLNSPDPAVAITARSLLASGYLDRDTGTIIIEVK
jgi:hypothetical protein